MGPAASEHRRSDEVASPSERHTYEADLLAEICHKLRTPLTSSMGFIQLCLRDARLRPGAPPNVANLEMVDQQLRRMAALLDELANYSRNS